MTFLCCFRSAVRPLDAPESPHLSPEDIEERERQEVRWRCPVLRVPVGNGSEDKIFLTDTVRTSAAYREMPHVHSAQRRPSDCARRARLPAGSAS